MRKLLLFLFVSIVIGMTGCLRDDDDTIALPIVSSGVVPDDIKGAFHGMVPIYEGIDPPNLTGNYILHPQRLVYASDGFYEPTEGLTDLYFSFQDQTADGSISYIAKEGYTQSSASEVHVVGSGSKFTAYFINNTEGYVIKNNEPYYVSYRMASIISGTVTDSGIENIQRAFALLEKYDPNNAVMDVGAYRVFKDGDGLAELKDWSKSAVDDAKCQSPIFTAISRTQKMK